MKPYYYTLFILFSIANRGISQRPLLLPCLIGEKWGYCDTNGVLIIPAEFDHAGYFTNQDYNNPYPLDFWYAPVRNGMSNNWIDATGKKLFSFDLIDNIKCQVLNKQLRMLTLSFSGKPYGLSALVDHQLRIVRPFESVNYRIYQFKGGADIWDYMEQQNIHYYWSPTYWNAIDLGKNILVEKRDEKRNEWQGILGPEGQVLVEPVFAQVTNIDEGKYLAISPQSNDWLLYALPNKLLDTFQYSPKTGINGGLVGACNNTAGGNGLCGFVNLNNKIVVPFRYTEIYGFYQGIALGQRPDGGWDVIDNRGKVHLTFQNLEDLVYFPNHFFLRQDSAHWKAYDYKFHPFPVKGLEGPPLGLRRAGNLCYRFKLGEDSVYVDFKGKELGRHPFDYIKQVEFTALRAEKPLKSNLFHVRQKGKWGFAKRLNPYSFQLVIPPQFDQISDFNRGYSRASIDGKWGIIDTLGRKIVPFEWDAAAVSSDFSNPDSLWIEVKKNKRKGLYDISGHLLVPCILQESSKCINLEGNKIWLDSLNFVNYLCDGKGKCLQFDSTYHFQQLFTVWDWYSRINRPCFLVRYHDKMGLMDSHGQWITNPAHNQCDITYNGRYYVTLDTGIWCLRERESGIILEKSTSQYHITGNDISNVRYDGDKSFYRLWSKNQKRFIESEYFIGRCSEGLICFITSSASGFYDETMHLVIPAIYDRAQDFYFGASIVTRNDHFGVIDKAGNILIPLEQRTIWRLKENYFLARKEGLDGDILYKAGIKLFAGNIIKIDTLSENRFLISHWDHESPGDSIKFTVWDEDSIRPSRMDIDSIKFSLVDGDGNLMINMAERIFPTSNGAAYIKQGKYGEYGREGKAPLPEIYNFGRINPIDENGLYRVGIVTGMQCTEILGLQGLVTKDSIPIIPIDYQSIDLIKETGEYAVYKGGKSALFGKNGLQKSSFQFDWGINFEPQVPFCYFVTQKDPSDKSARIDWWITRSGRPVGIKRKWRVN